MEESVERVKRYLKNFEGDKEDFEAIVNILNGYIEYKNKELKGADNLFFETSYNDKKTIVSQGKIIYEQYEAGRDYIKFKNTGKEIYISGNITKKELEAINRKVEELRWNEN